MTRLIFIHGRKQEGLDPAALKDQWFMALARGAAAAQKDLPVRPDQVDFYYYGQALADGIAPKSGQALTEPVLRHVLGGSPGAIAEVEPELAAFAEFLEPMVVEILREAQEVPVALREGHLANRARTQSQNIAAANRGPLQWGWVQRALELVDRYVPGASGAVICLVFRDVYHYLVNQELRRRVVQSAAELLPTTGRHVVVSHSLGTVVAHDLLNYNDPERNWQIPLWVTLGSPLRIKFIHRNLWGGPVFPVGVMHWLNGYDERDLIALHGIEDIAPPLECLYTQDASLQNASNNRHGIGEYLCLSEVAGPIIEAINAAE